LRTNTENFEGDADMSTTRLAAVIGLVLVMASGLSLATTNYAYDSGTAGGGITWGPGYTYALNIFPTGTDNIIDQLQVAWGNLAPGTNAQVLLYSMTSRSPSSAQLLQQVGTTVTSGQVNGAGLSFDGVNNAEHFYTGTATNINTGTAGETPATITNPVWSSYSITPTAVTTPFFGVATIVSEPDPNTIAPTLLDIGNSVSGANMSWVGYNGATYTTDLSAITGGGDYVANFSGYGTSFGTAFANNPYLIRAEGTSPIPEPITMASLVLAMGALGGYLKRRKAQASEQQA
jgi:hypothetical protein